MQQSEQLDAARRMVAAGEHAAALPLLVGGVTWARRAYGPTAPDTLDAEDQLGSCYLELDEPEYARSVLERAYKLRKEGGSSEAALGYTGHQLAVAYSLLGQTLRAVEAGREAHATRRRALGPSHVNTLATAVNLAADLNQAGQSDEAARLLERALPEIQWSRGEDDGFALKAEHELALAYANLGRIDEAIAAGQEAFAARRRVFGPDDPRTLHTATNLGVDLSLAGHHAEALEILRETRDRRRATAGPDAPETLVVTVYLGVVLNAADEPAEVVGLLEPALAACRRVWGDEDDDTLTAWNELVMAYGSLGRTDDAVTTGRAALDALRGHVGPDHPGVLGMKAYLGFSLNEAGLHDEALRVLAEALASARRVLGDDAPVTATAWSQLARAHRDLGHRTEAIETARDALPAVTTAFGEGDASRLVLATDLARDLLDAGRPAESVEILGPVLETCRELIGDDDELTTSAEEVFARAREEVGLRPPRANQRRPAVREPAEHADTTTSTGAGPDEALAALDRLVGLSAVKAEVHRLAAVARVRQMRKAKGLPVHAASHHLILTGNPGTGKTTVARLIGDIFREIGLLSTGHLVEVGRSELVGQWIGHTENRTRALFERALGGVLFIDEAYALAPSDEGDRDFGRQAIDELVKLVEDHRSDLVVILAGYPDKMQRLLDMNPGLRGRFPRRIHFPDYTNDELVAVFDSFCHENGYSPDDQVRSAVRRVVASFPRNEAFANARVVRNVVELALERQAERLASVRRPTKAQLSTLLPDDVPAPTDVDPALTPTRATSAIVAELDGLVGLTDVKQAIRGVLASAQVDARKAARGLGRVLVSRHLVFTGNPGTGKTTVARLLGELYGSIGVLSRGQLIEANRESLTVGYLSQTEKRTKAVFESALGGVLFIDEAYALVPADASERDFGRDVINTLNALIEDHRDDIVVILAGYPGMLELFDRVNRGWSGRFPTEVRFPDYSADELYRIFSHLVAANGYRLARGASPAVKSELASRRKDPAFGNARGVRNLFEAVLSRQAVRLSDVEDASDVDLVTISAVDVRSGPGEGRPPLRLVADT